MERSPDPLPAEPRSAEPLPPGDADLIAASRTGDAAAYATLYQRHAPAAHGLARQLVRGQAEADDVVAAFKQLERNMRTDKTGGAGNEHFHGMTSYSKASIDCFARKHVFHVIDHR